VPHACLRTSLGPRTTLCADSFHRTSHCFETLVTSHFTIQHDHARCQKKVQWKHVHDCMDGKDDSSSARLIIPAAGSVSLIWTKFSGRQKTTVHACIATTLPSNSSWSDMKIHACQSSFREPWTGTLQHDGDE
jgi:hypothetical protein